jgi:nickel transport protein
MRRFAVVASLSLAGLAAAPPVAAHGIHSSVERSEAVVVTLRYADGTPFAGQPYEVRAAGSQSALVTGETDPRGRVAFLPPGEGPWRVQARSPGGHGATVTVESGMGATVEGDDAAPQGQLAAQAERKSGPGPSHEHGAAEETAAGGGGSRLVLGLGLILAGFGAWSLWRCRQRPG